MSATIRDKPCDSTPKVTVALLNESDPAKATLVIEGGCGVPEQGSLQRGGVHLLPGSWPCLHPSTEAAHWACTPEEASQPSHWRA